MMEFFTPEALSALAQVIMIDLVLAGDNAIVIGLAAAGLPKDQRAKAILIGIIAATVLRIGFALATTQLLQIVGLLLAGGVLLLWVCWKMWRELRDGVLVCPVRGPPPAPRVTQWLVCPHDRLRRRRVRAFIDWVRAERDLRLAARDGRPGWRFGQAYKLCRKSRLL